MPDADWLEPSCGEGAFLIAISALGVERERVTGVDLVAAHSAADAYARVIRSTDFLGWSEGREASFDRIVGNPPFARLSLLEPQLRRAALARALACGEAAPGTGNYWLPFLVASLGCLRHGGKLGFILPAAWDYAAYASPIRTRIGALFARVEVHRSLRPLFPGRRDGSVVLLAEGYRTGFCAPTRFEHADSRALIEALNGKPSATVEAPHRSVRARRLLTTVPAREVASVSIGAVTGDSAFFLLGETGRATHSLPRSSVVPVVSRASHVRSAELNAGTWRKLRDAGERVWLFRPSSSALMEPAVQRYLNEGGCNRSRYKVRSRAEWYRTPLPPSADGFMSGMSKDAPWICLNRSPTITASNTLYVVRFNGNLPIAQQAAWCLSFLHPCVREAAERNVRHYADGLRKLEPGDILGLPLVVAKGDESSLATYREALGLLLTGEARESARLAEAWLRTHRA